MSNTNKIQEQNSSSNHSCYGANNQYLSGIIFDGSMFPPGRDERVWGAQHPLDIVHHAVHFDDESGDESWRVTNYGRYIYTGEAHVRRQIINARSPQETGKAQTVHHTAEPRKVLEAASHKRFPDALPVPSTPGRIVTPHGNNTARQSALRPSPRPPTIVHTATSGPTRNIDDPQNSSIYQTRLLAPAAPTPRPHHSPNVASKRKSTNHDPQKSPYHPAVLADTQKKTRLPQRNPPKTASPRGTNDWDDDSLLNLWKLKTIRKKGYEPMLPQFPGHTSDSLAQTWKAHRSRCTELGIAWRAAGKPDGRVAEWLVE